MQIIEKRDFIALPNGLSVPRPTRADYKRAEMLTKEQESLYTELCNLPNTEQGHGRANSIKRQVARLERKKHYCLQVMQAHLFPNEYKGLVG